MEDIFILEVDYKGVIHPFEAQLQMAGYIHRFVVSLPNTDVWFERDEEGNYRALLPPDTHEKEVQKMDSGLLQAISQKIESILA